MLQVDGLQAGYGRSQILDGISLHVHSGEMVGLVGANGAGKTTLVRTLAGLLPARSGEIVLDGVDLTAVPAHLRIRAGLAVVLENRNLFGALTVAENLRIATRSGRFRRQEFTLDRILDLFPALRPKREVMCSLLSGGQQQMVAIARALLLQPSILVMDEPSTGLAPNIVKDILTVMGALCQEGMSVILIEQNLAIASSTTSRAYVMSAGRIAFEVADGQWASFLADRSLVSAYLGEQG